MDANSHFEYQNRASHIEKIFSVQRNRRLNSNDLVCDDLLGIYQKNYMRLIEYYLAKNNLCRKFIMKGNCNSRTLQTDRLTDDDKIINGLNKQSSTKSDSFQQCCSHHVAEQGMLERKSEQELKAFDKISKNKYVHRRSLLQNIDVDKVIAKIGDVCQEKNPTQRDEICDIIEPDRKIFSRKTQNNAKNCDNFLQQVDKIDSNMHENVPKQMHFNSDDSVTSNQSIKLLYHLEKNSMARPKIDDLRDSLISLQNHEYSRIKDQPVISHLNNLSIPRLVYDSNEGERNNSSDEAPITFDRYAKRAWCVDLLKKVERLLRHRQLLQGRELIGVQNSGQQTRQDIRMYLEENGIRFDDNCSDYDAEGKVRLKADHRLDSPREDNNDQNVCHVVRQFHLKQLNSKMKRAGNLVVQENEHNDLGTRETVNIFLS